MRTIWAALKAGDFDLYYGECKLTADWDLSPLLSPGGALNYGGVRDTQLETLLTAFRTASEGEGRQTAARELCSYLKEQAPWWQCASSPTPCCCRRGR